MSDRKILLSHPEAKREKAIEQHKQFYKTYLLNTANVEALLPTISALYHKHKSSKAAFYFPQDAEWQKLDNEIVSFIKKNWSDKLVEIYTQNIVLPKKKRERTKGGKWTDFLLELGEIFNDVKERNEAKWNHQSTVLLHLYHAIKNFGLHPLIEERDPQAYKRFNVLLYHYYKSRQKQVAHNLCLLYNDLDEKFLRLYTQKKRVKFGGLLIPFDSIHEVRITTTLLKDDEIVLFAKKHGFVWSETEKDALAFINNCKDETEKYHPNPDEYSVEDGINWEQVGIAKTYLSIHPKSKSLLSKAFVSFKKGSTDRVILDNARLALELFLCGFFSNEKSLENQLAEIGKYQKQRGASPEVVNMFQKLIEVYTKYQNTYIKHDDSVKPEEISLILNLTTIFITHFAK